MTRRAVTVAVFLLAAVCIIAVSGCAGTTGSEVPNDPDLIRRDISDLDQDILNAEEMYKAGLTELQMEETSDLRREVNRLWIELEHLRSQKAALEQRLGELEAQKKS
jgi:predicted nuclease with TOPRIM domain